jgi:hypothetical protein
MIKKLLNSLSVQFLLEKGWVNEKQNNSRVNWVIKIYLHFQSMTPSNIED